MKRFSRFITEKKMTHVIDRNTGKSVYGPTDVADAKRYLKKQIQPNKFMIKDIKESVELEDGKQVTVKQFVSDEAAQSAIEDAEGLLDSTEVMSGVFAMVFDSKVSKDNFVATHKDSLKEEVKLDEQTRHTVHVKVSRQSFRKLESMIASLMSYEESDYSDGKARFYFDAKKHDGAERKKVAEFIKKTRGAEFSHAVKEDVQLDEDGHTDVASAKTKVDIARKALIRMEQELSKLPDEASLPSWWTDKVAIAVDKLDGMADYLDSVVEDTQLDEGRMQNTVKKMNNKQKAILAKQLNKMDLSGYGDYMADVRNVHKFKDKDLERALNKVLPSVAAMALKEAPNPEFLKVYDSLKKGDRVEVEFDSGIRKGNKITLVVTSGHRVVGRAKVGRIIMKSPDNMRGVSYTLYNRNGSVSLALGDMATVMKSIKKK